MNGQLATTAAMPTALSHCVQSARIEYLEMPGLHLTKRQMQRLWNLDGTSVDALLDLLVDVKFLRCTPAGGYVRADGGA